MNHLKAFKVVFRVQKEGKLSGLQNSAASATSATPMRLTDLFYLFLTGTPCPWALPAAGSDTGNHQNLIRAATVRDASPCDVDSDLSANLTAVRKRIIVDAAVAATAFSLVLPPPSSSKTLPSLLASPSASHSRALAIAKAGRFSDSAKSFAAIANVLTSVSVLADSELETNSEPSPSASSRRGLARPDFVCIYKPSEACADPLSSVARKLFLIVDQDTHHAPRIVLCPHYIDDLRRNGLEKHGVDIRDELQLFLAGPLFELYTQLALHPPGAVTNPPPLSSIKESSREAGDESEQLGPKHAADYFRIAQLLRCSDAEFAALAAVEFSTSAPGSLALALPTPDVPPNRSAHDTPRNILCCRPGWWPLRPRRPSCKRLGISVVTAPLRLAAAVMCLPWALIMALDSQRRWDTESMSDIGDDTLCRLLSCLGVVVVPELFPTVWNESPMCHCCGEADDDW